MKSHIQQRQNLNDVPSSGATGDDFNGHTFLVGKMSKNRKNGKATGDGKGGIGNGRNQANTVDVFLLVRITRIGNGGTWGKS